MGAIDDIFFYGLHEVRLSYEPVLRVGMCGIVSRGGVL
jgi:hypothetical protein